MTSTAIVTTPATNGASTPVAPKGLRAIVQHVKEIQQLEQNPIARATAIAAGETVLRKQEQKREAIEGAKAEQPHAKVVPKALSIEAPIAKLRAAVAIAAKSDIREYLKGVHLRRRGAVLHIIGTDGHRMLVLAQSLPPNVADDESRDWTEGGVILPRDDLAQVLTLCEKHGDTISLSISKGEKTATITSADQFAQFRLRLVEGTFPDYQRVLDAVDLTNQGEVMGAAALNPAYLKSVGEVAKLIGSDTVQAFTANEKTASVFLFPGDSGAILIVMPMQGAGGVTPQNVAMLPGATRASISALRAHVTRIEKAEGFDPKNPGERHQLLMARISALSSTIAIEGPKAKPEPKPIDAPATGAVQRKEDRKPSKGVVLQAAEVELAAARTLASETKH